MNEKKLRLNKETIRNLSDESLEQVAGGNRKSGSVVFNIIGVCISNVVLNGDHNKC